MHLLWRYLRITKLHRCPCAVWTVYQTSTLDIGLFKFQIVLSNHLNAQVAQQLCRKTASTVIMYPCPCPPTVQYQFPERAICLPDDNSMLLCLLLMLFFPNESVISKSKSEHNQSYFQILFLLKISVVIQADILRNNCNTTIDWLTVNGNRV